MTEMLPQATYACATTSEVAPSKLPHQAQASHDEKVTNSLLRLKLHYHEPPRKRDFILATPCAQRPSCRSYRSEKSSSHRSPIMAAVASNRPKYVLTMSRPGAPCASQTTNPAKGRIGPTTTTTRRPPPIFRSPRPSQIRTAPRPSSHSATTRTATRSRPPAESATPHTPRP